jgi:hypothetical protein
VYNYLLLATIILYWCESLGVTLSEEPRMMVFEITCRMARKILWPKKEKYLEVLENCRITNSLIRAFQKMF